jgi:peptidoglycan/LPS O-acetylase OafA/YrhL
MLRIWPLYYLMVFIGLVLIPAGARLGRVPYEAPFQSLEVAPYFLLFIPFVVNLAYGNHFLTPLWSVGVEEIYYAAWAPVVKFLRKRIVTIMLAVVVAKILLSAWAHHSKNVLAQDVLRMLQFEAMAIGGLASCFVFNCKRRLHSYWLFSTPVQLAVVFCLVAELLAHRALVAESSWYAAVFAHAVITPYLMMVIFAWFITHVAVNERSILRLDWRPLNYLGEISYGIYVYHALAISLVFVPFLDEYRALPAVPAAVVLHLLVATLTVLMAALSKTFFEDRFLRYKLRFHTLDAAPPTITQDQIGAPTKPNALAA